MAFILRVYFEQVRFDEICISRTLLVPKLLVAAVGQLPNHPICHRDVKFLWVTCFDQSRHRCHRFEGEFHKLHSCKDFRWKTHEHMEAPPWVAMSRHGKHISVYHGFSTLRRLLYIMFYVYINIYRDIYIYIYIQHYIYDIYVCLSSTNKRIEW